MSTASHTSRPSIAPNSKRPRVGYHITTERITLPLIKEGSINPTLLINGFIATFYGYFNTTFHADSPLA